jgi:hypothetical protein
VGGLSEIFEADDWKSSVGTPGQITIHADNVDLLS